jgi:hypothetical protein
VKVVFVSSSGRRPPDAVDARSVRDRGCNLVAARQQPGSNEQEPTAFPHAEGVGLLLVARASSLATPA